MSTPELVRIAVAVIICVAVWFAIGFVPEPTARTESGSRTFPIRWILYVLDIVWLIWYLSRYL